MSEKRRVNPVTVEIIRSALQSAAEDMNASLFRSAFSPVIYEMKDCSVGIFNEKAEMLGQSAGLPIFLGNLEECIKITIDMYGVGFFQEGDVLVMNDAYMTGTHLNDMTVFSPIFYEGQLVGFAANRAHWLDVGSKDPGMTTDSTEIYQEGIRIGPTKIVERGRPREDVLDLIVRNSRFHEQARGDLNAQISACRTGEKRYREIIARFGLEIVRAATEDIFAQSERLDREAIVAIPDGVYEAEGFLDSDGLSDDPVKVQVKVIINGSDMTIDLAGSSPQRRGATNCGVSQTVSACRVAYKALIQPQAPVNGGTFRALTVKAPAGSIFTAQEPAAVSWYFSHLGLLIDLVGKALSPALPDRTAAAHYGDSMVVTFAGVDPRNGAPFLTVEATVGGWGAFSRADGQNALINNVNGDFKNLPVEVMESKYPITVRRYAIRQNTGGPGKFRGGTGAIREYQIHADDGYLYLWWERSKTPAWGILGGQDGQPPVVIVNPSTPEEKRVLKVNGLKLGKGYVVSAQTGGGGGFGDPLDRDPARVREDVIDGYIDRAHAELAYGVRFVPGTDEVDVGGTSALRGQMRQRRKSA
ncbi:MAG: hydantoinase B/oxoprolinase family protein [Actinobacteria bacterium]|nr:hydantoinase B/oxoprolinase family protein [Actinomycetota bacterium]